MWLHKWKRKAIIPPTGDLSRSGGRGPMEVSNLPISPSHRGKLLAAGYGTLASLSSVSPKQLAEGTSSSYSQVLSVNPALLADRLDSGCQCMRSCFHIQSYVHFWSWKKRGTKRLQIFVHGLFWYSLYSDEVLAKILPTSYWSDRHLSKSVSVHCSCPLTIVFNVINLIIHRFVPVSQSSITVRVHDFLWSPSFFSVHFING